MKFTIGSLYRKEENILLYVGTIDKEMWWAKEKKKKDKTKVVFQKQNKPISIHKFQVLDDEEGPFTTLYLVPKMDRGKGTQLKVDNDSYGSWTSMGEHKWDGVFLDDTINEIRINVPDANRSYWLNSIKNQDSIELPEFIS